MSYARAKLACGISYVSDGFHWCGHRLWALALWIYPETKGRIVL